VFHERSRGKPTKLHDRGDHSASLVIDDGYRA
jgi:hypothetical protein